MPSPFQIATDDSAPAGASLLARWRFGVEPGLPQDLVPPLPLLAGDAEQRWLGESPVRGFSHQGIVGADNGQALVARLTLPPPADGDWQALAREAYARVAAFQAGSGYPGLLKIWNYLPQITCGAGDQERYRQFSLGRHEGWRWAADAEVRLPSAVAIGSEQGGLALMWLAARRPGLQIENPRQTSAFRYPREYGPIGPSFSRATLMPWGGRDEQLYVSGTASIVGHRSLHAGDVRAQLEEILRNLAALCAEAQRRAGRDAEPLARSLIAYVRRPADAGFTLQRLRQAFGPATAISVLRGDVCRAELLVEVEGLFSF